MGGTGEGAESDALRARTVVDSDGMWYLEFHHRKAWMDVRWKTLATANSEGECTRYRHC